MSEWPDVEKLNKQGKYKELYEDLLDQLDKYDGGFDARVNIKAPEDEAVKNLCERIGYGAAMDSVMRLWLRKDRVGAFVCGPCAGTVRGLREKFEKYNNPAPPSGERRRHE